MAKATLYEFLHHNLITDSEQSPVVAVAADALVIPVTHPIVGKTSGADAEALTLANGLPGQSLIVNLIVAGGGACTLTPATSYGWNTVVLLGQYDQVVLLYVDGTIGWVIIGASGTDAPPVIA